MGDDEDRGLAAWAAEGIEPEAAPAPEPAPEPVAEPEAVAEVVETVAEATEADEPEESPEPATDAGKPAKGKIKPIPPWVKDRLAEVTAKQRAAEAKAVEAEARALAAEARAEARERTSPEGEQPAKVGAKPSTQPGYVPASEVEARAVKIAAETAMNARADQTYYAGKAAYEDFDAAIAPLQEMGAFNRPEFYDAVFATDAPQDVIYHLGSNPNEASKIVGLLKSGNATKAAVEIARIEGRLAAQKAAPKANRPISKAPAPIKPVGGSAVPGDIAPEKMDDEAFDKEFFNLARTRGWM